MSDGMNLAGKVAVVTGAGRGVGREIALKLAKHGATLALAARTPAQLHEVEQLIRSNGGTALSVETDVSNPASVQNLKQQVETQLGVPAILVNGAGVFGPIQFIKDSDPGPWIETLMINTVAAYLTSRAFVNGMIDAGWGRIVNLSSAAALHPPGGFNSAYGTSKVALNYLTRSLASELNGTGVTVNVIHPGDVKTEMWADVRDKVNLLGPGAEGYRSWVKWVEETGGDPPHKAADLVLRIVSDDAASVNGQFLWIEDSLQAPIPSWGDSNEKMPWDAKK